ncbi:hypothetical protein N657DRAFT_645468 [Parathielavia appendiculata]|uniref:Uncharacterized protein n=1 Tax=Parathielavia appendiculata TaxID=2587402 RepID=A0AAN6Z4J1_9PEZI|nr:hypothetical protein N657DRAFT_645468 [Parathielavia appendiculata]
MVGMLSPDESVLRPAVTPQPSTKKASKQSNPISSTPRTPDSVSNLPHPHLDKSVRPIFEIAYRDHDSTTAVYLIPNSS